MDHHKKIALVTDAIYPYNKGGKEKKTFETSTRLATMGYDVHIYTMKWWKGDRMKRENGVTLHGISPLYPLYSGKRRSIKEAILFGLHTLTLLREDFDVVDVDHMPHLVLFPMKLVCLLKRKKMIASWNEVWGTSYWVSYMGNLGYIAGFIEKISAMLPDKVISISPYTTEQFKKLLTHKTSIVTIPCGIDIQKIQKVKPSKEKFDLVFAGRLLSHKHVEILIEAVLLLKNDFPHISALIIGNGPEKENLQNLIHTNGLEKLITIRDFVPDEDGLYALIKSSKVFVFPSTREGFGLIALEANACGVPVVTTNYPDNATRYLIKNGFNGYAVPLIASAFAKKIAVYLKGKKENREAITESVKKFDWDNIVKLIEKEYFS